ncbi:uncharacterized protein LOC126672651 [Mercurialis annua]|uniref:uncharacterized protein LOC126672651 n=1 Tax=Mercurialis annua TaxID=3986 RepID=UPI00215FDE82|nr:uncharacterized protein LOC126672651 [Mercurialis annua]
MTGSVAGMILRGPHKIKMLSSVNLNFPTTNNSAEYEALIRGLRMATVVKAEYIKVQSDSKLVVNQIRNTEADTLAKAGAAKETIPVVRSSIQNFNSIKNPEMTFLINLLDQWMEHIITYIENGSLPEDKKEARKVKRRAPHFSYRDDTLYIKSFLYPWSRCLTAKEGKYVLAEMHEGICGSHISHLALCGKAVLQGYYWPTLAQDAASLVQKCEKCQYHQNVHHKPTIEQNPIVSPWPFSIWGIDIIGPFPTASGQRKFLIVDVDHFFQGIDLRFTLVTHPQTNGMTEVTNRTIVNGTTPKGGTERTPYSLTYGCKTMVPVGIGMPTIQVQYFDEQQNEENTRVCLDLLEERREQALMHIEAYKQRMGTYHNKRVKPLTFEVGDLVLRRADIARGNA